MIAGIEWGTAPNWLEAVGTIAAVTVALWLASSEQRYREVTEARRGAKRLSVGSHSIGKIDLANHQHYEIYEATFKNAGDRAFFDITIDYSDPRLSVDPIERLGPSESRPDIEVGRASASRIGPLSSTFATSGATAGSSIGNTS